MSTIEGARRREVYRQVTGLLLDDTCRGIVRILRVDTDPFTEAELAERLLAENPDLDDPPGSVVASLFRELYRHHLPALVENGLVHWDETDQSVTSTYHPLYHSDQPAELVAATSLDALAGVLDDARRREVIACFDGDTGPVGCGDLARRVASMEVAGTPEQSLVDAVTTGLQDHHLPELDAFGLVAYDPDGGTVTYSGPPSLAAVLHRRLSSDDPHEDRETVVPHLDEAATDGSGGT